MSFNIQTLKKLVYDRLKDDSALVILLGGTANIFHFYPKQESNIPYPIVVYSVLGIEDNPYDADKNANINSLILNIDIFSSDSSMKEADDIADRIYALLHGQNFSNDDVIVYSCYRDFQDENYETDGQVWRINARYNLTNAGK